MYKIDLLERSTDEASERLKRYLSYKRTCSGEALKAARSDYQDAARDRIIKATLPNAWTTLLGEPDSLLLDLLAEKVEDLCGYKPALDTCGQFIENIVDAGSVRPPPPNGGREVEPRPGGSGPHKPERFTLCFKGSKYEFGSARDVMVKVFQLLAREDSGFLERFAARKHGRTRRYLATENRELYPGRPDLAEEYSVEIVPGWWMGTNYSRKNIRGIIELAREVAGQKLDSVVQVKWD
ncbi:MAG: hypothetical protein HW402_1530 [Dehalococcoidales bacterium]|nr:hypothetical protein [Dehalococcoidales bacterium]